MAGKQNIKYYSLDNILQRKAHYNVIIGERSNGKTYACLVHAIRQFVKDRSQFAYIRRWKEDITFKRMRELFAAIIADGKVAELTHGEYHGVWCYNGRFYLCNYDEKDNRPIYNEDDLLGFALALNEMEHNKSISYPKIKTIVFDEFMTRTMYLTDEFIVFMNTLSTIIRQRDNVQIFMLGNTVTKMCPYFQEMGLSHVKNQKQGTIEIYNYGDSPLKTAVEYCGTLNKEKKSNVYFAFDNPKLQMITSGIWELGIYNHLPCKYKPKDIKFTYFIEFNGNIYQCEVIQVDRQYFTYIHDKTTPIQNEEKDLIYSLDYHATLNYCRNILKPVTAFQKKIAWFFVTDNVCYQDNTVGDAIHSYLSICKRRGI